jgi:dipeptidase D
VSELSQLSPQPLWDIFAKICSIPHPSFHEEALASYIVGWAKEQGFWCERDQVGNILIRKPATAGMENRKPVALQAHLDMVPQKNNDTVHDFTKDPIQPWIDGEWVKARGTTLGADNGIGMASALAVLADDCRRTRPAGSAADHDRRSRHGWRVWPASQLAAGRYPDQYRLGRRRRNLHGLRRWYRLHPPCRLAREAIPAGFQTLKLTLKGLKGGHSGGDIHVGLGNANKLLARFLAATPPSWMPAPA